jgi:hypothetical protein
MNSTDRKFAIGCVILVALGFLGTFAIFKGALKLVDKGKTLVKSTLAEQQRLRAIEGSWAPPTEKLEASWFPAEIGEWKRSSAELLMSLKR